MRRCGVGSQWTFASMAWNKSKVIHASSFWPRWMCGSAGASACRSLSSAHPSKKPSDHGDTASLGIAIARDHRKSRSRTQAAKMSSIFHRSPAIQAGGRAPMERQPIDNIAREIPPDTDARFPEKPVEDRW